MNILYISHYFHPFSVGGVEDDTRMLAGQMLARGHGVHVFHGVIDRGTDDYAVTQHVHREIPCTSVSVDLKTIDDWSGTWRQSEVEKILDRLLDSQTFDVVHIQHLTRLSTGLVELLHARGIPTVLTIYDFWMQCARGQRVRPDGTICNEVVETLCAECMAPEIDFLDLRKSALRRALLVPGRGRPGRHAAKIAERRGDMLAALERVDLLLTPSAFVRESFRSYGVRREILVEPPAVDPALAVGYQPTTSPVLRFGYFGRLEKTKGLDVLVDAFTRMGVEAELSIFGPGSPEYVGSLRERAGNARICFEGPYDGSKIAPLYSRIDVQIVPSTWLECSPLVIQNARLFRKPLLVSAHGGLVDLVRDGVDGLLFKVGDADDLAEKMRRLVLDTALYRRLVDSSPPTRSTQALAADFERHYERLASARWTSRSSS